MQSKKLKNKLLQLLRLKKLLPKIQKALLIKSRLIWTMMLLLVDMQQPVTIGLFQVNIRLVDCLFCRQTLI